MICGWDKTGPTIFYVDSDGNRVRGDAFCVGSGQTFAYGLSLLSCSNSRCIGFWIALRLVCRRGSCVRPTGDSCCRSP